MRWFSVYFLGIILMLSAACSDKQGEQLRELNQMKRTSDSVTFDLNAINLQEVSELYNQCNQQLTNLKSSIGNDTLDLSFAQQVESVKFAEINLRTLKEEILQCRIAQREEMKRIHFLQKDIHNGAGDRSEYAQNIALENRELTKIRNHSIELKRRFESAKSAIEQFQPEIERYLTQNVP